MRTAYLTLILLGWLVCSGGVDVYALDWEPQPDPAALMVINAHPDDEGLFLGGAIPFYSQVRNLPVVMVDMVSSRPNRPTEQATREQELANAAWVYGMRNPPIFARFRDHSDLPGGTGSLTNTWNAWDGDITNGPIDADQNGIPDGRDLGTLFLAEQIRRYKPSVILTHDPRGEYGHGGHMATSITAQDAYALAADPTVEIAGLAPWQAQKLYIGAYEDYRDPGVPVLNHFYHDFSTPYPELAGMTPAQVTDLGLLEHASEGGQSLPNTFTGRRYIEQWSLRFSEVGADHVQAMDIDGQVYADLAAGDFFQNITTTRFEHLLADANQDGIVGVLDLEILLANWNQTVPWGSVQSGDINADGLVSIQDLTRLLRAWNMRRTNPPDQRPRAGLLAVLSHQRIALVNTDSQPPQHLLLHRAALLCGAVRLLTLRLTSNSIPPVRGVPDE